MKNSWKTDIIPLFILFYYDGQGLKHQNMAVAHFRNVNCPTSHNWLMMARWISRWCCLAQFELANGIIEFVDGFNFFFGRCLLWFWFRFVCVWGAVRIPCFNARWLQLCIGFAHWNSDLFFSVSVCVSAGQKYANVKRLHIDSFLVSACSTS